ncbi:hypothetical protein ACF09E_34700 [Streptomyces sp. NPDC014891]|uniref:hypothetical protein n=1 Tax=Streptomyces sp. NPDC014891 TaxID=3364929 RepID=UPI0036FDDC35
MAARTATRKPTRKTTTGRKPPAPRRPAEEPAAVTPAAGVREEADPIIADARDRAADNLALATEVLDVARLTAVAEAAGIRQDAEAQAVTIRRAAATAARQVLAESADAAGDRLRQATEEVEALRQRSLAQDETRVAEVLAAAMADAEEQAGQMLAEAEDQVSAVLATAEERATALVDMRRVSAEAAYRTALEDAAKILGEAQEKAAEIAARRAGLDIELELTRRSAMLDLEEEVAARRKGLEAELGHQRQENDRAQALVENEFRELGEKHVREREEQRQRLTAEAEQLRRRAEADARAAAASAAAEIRKEAAAVLREAEQERDAAQAARKLAEKRAKSLENKQSRGEILKQVSLWTGLGAVIILTASGEWAFASLVGLGRTPLGDAAWALPVGLDIYVVTAFRKKKDVPFALGLMAATNLTYHAADMTGVGIEIGADGAKHPSVWLISVAVLAVVLIVWRIHRLLEDGEEEKPATAEQPEASDSPGDVTGTEPRTDRSDASRTGQDDPARTADRTDGPDADRTADDRTARTEPVRTDRTDGRTGQDRTARTAATRTARTATRTAKTRTGPAAPARTDAECVTALRELPRTADGFVTVNAARTALGCNRDRAVRLLDEAGLLSPADRAKHLTPTR